VQLKNVELVKLGHRIRRARKLLGFSQKDFSAKCGLDRSYLGGVERGNRNVTFGVLCTICDGLTCDIAAVTKGIPHLASLPQQVPHYNPDHPLGWRFQPCPLSCFSTEALPRMAIHCEAEPFHQVTFSPES